MGPGLCAQKLRIRRNTLLHSQALLKIIRCCCLNVLQQPARRPSSSIPMLGSPLDGVAEVGRLFGQGGVRLLLVHGLTDSRDASNLKQLGLGALDSFWVQG